MQDLLAAGCNWTPKELALVVMLQVVSPIAKSASQLLFMHVASLEFAYVRVVLNEYSA